MVVDIIWLDTNAVWYFTGSEYRLDIALTIIKSSLFAIKESEMFEMEAVVDIKFHSKNTDFMCLWVILNYQDM